MSQSETKCQECGGNVTAGLLADRSEQALYELYWIEGEPEYMSI